MYARTRPAARTALKAVLLAHLGELVLYSEFLTFKLGNDGIVGVGAAIFFFDHCFKLGMLGLQCFDLARLCQRSGLL